MRLSQLSALSLLDTSSSESLSVENGELLSTSSYRLLRLRDEPSSMETGCLRGKKQEIVSHGGLRNHSSACNHQAQVCSAEASVFLKDFDQPLIVLFRYN